MQWSDFRAIVTAELPGIITPLLDQTARLVGIDFLETTQLQVVDLDPVDVVAGTGEYSLDAPSTDTIVSEVLAAWLAGVPLKFIPSAQLRRTGTFWPGDTGAPQGYTQLTPASVILYPQPIAGATAGLRTRVSLKPSRISAGLEDWIGEKYFFDIANGIKAKLMAMPGQSWSNADGATMYGGLYVSARKDATVATGRNAPKARLTE